MTQNDRSALLFNKVVEENFGFLLSKGFQQVQSEPTFVRFESKGVFVNIYHGRQSFEVGLEIGPLGGDPDDKCYSMSELVQLVEPDKAHGYRNFIANSKESIMDGVRRLAALFHLYFDAVIMKDAGLFERLRINREKWAHDYAREVTLVRVRRNLEQVWRAKDYTAVVMMLRPFRDVLSPAELHKYEYAEKHAKPSN
jgi:hypothetical protein